MSTQLVSQSPYAANSLTKADVYDVQQVAQKSAKITQIAQAVDHEVAQIGAHAVGTMAQLVQTAGDTQRRLTDSGHGSALYDDAQSKILQVTGTNLITLANTAQKEIVQQAAALMR